MGVVKMVMSISSLYSHADLVTAAIVDGGGRLAPAHVTPAILKFGRGQFQFAATQSALPNWQSSGAGPFAGLPD